jgi:hypothetical protein
MTKETARRLLCVAVAINLQAPTRCNSPMKLRRSLPRAERTFCLQTISEAGNYGSQPNIVNSFSNSDRHLGRQPVENSMMKYFSQSLIK